MKRNRLNELFSAARGEMPPPTPEGFAERVLRGLPPAPLDRAKVLPLWGQLDAAFTGCALAAAALIVLCLATEAGQSFRAGATFTEEVARLYLDQAMD